ncbi:MAG: hypothetical protein HKN09_07835 [Saprospiraceae bacterium]|nr:hypothetical protein [Saprospiraceae bacterium]
MNVIPQSSPIYTTLNELAENAQIVVFSGLPGIGKSLYINAFYALAKQHKRSITVVQWDQARKAFETDDILRRFPMGDGTVHNGFKLMAGEYIKNKILSWTKHANSADLLLIEAPLVGHRFIEIVEQSDIEELEAALASEKCRIIVPIPSKEVRRKIEEARAAQVDDNAKVWIGAKPSVLKMLWNMVYDIAIEFGAELEEQENPPYDPEVVEFVFSKVCKHRNFVPLHVDEVFEVPEQSEAELHSLESEMPSKEEVNTYFNFVNERFDSDDQIDQYVNSWYWQ